MIYVELIMGDHLQLNKYVFGEEDWSALKPLALSIVPDEIKHIQA
jgi:hypothetical protein